MIRRFHCAAYAWFGVACWRLGADRRIAHDPRWTVASVESPPGLFVGLATIPTLGLMWYLAETFCDLVT
jgi:hypothetical protein